jgi:heme A synthase
MTHNMWLRVPEAATMGLLSLVVLVVAVGVAVALGVLTVMGAVAIAGLILGHNLTAG